MAHLILRLKGREILRHEIALRTTRIGREQSNEIVIDNPGVSRIHAAVVFEDPDFVVIDQGSANGVYVNGERTAMHRLQHGDRIEIGKFELEFTANYGSEALRGDMVVEAPKSPVQTVVLPSVTDADLE